VMAPDDLPAHVLATFGAPGREWISSMVEAVISSSLEAGEVTMDATRLEVMHDLREWMFANVYLRPEAVAQAEKAMKVVRDLVDWFVAHPEEVPASYRVPDSDDVQAAVDYVAGMSDKYAMRLYDERFRPAGLY
jgi:dGTPase